MPGGRCPMDEEFEKNGFGFEKMDSLEDERLVILRADNIKLQEQLDAACKTKEAMVMRYAMSEKEVIKLKGEVDNSDKKIKNLMKELESLNQQNKQLNAERNHFAQLSQAKNPVIDEEKKALKLKVEELLKEIKCLEITKSQFAAEFAREKKVIEDANAELHKTNEALLSEVAMLKEDLKKSQEQLQETSELHYVHKECEKLKEELSSKEFLLKWTQDRVASLESECENLRSSNSDVLNDMTVCRSKEEELLAYTQQVTEKNVALQSQVSDMELKVKHLDEENKKLKARIEESVTRKADYEENLTMEKQALKDERSSFLKQIEEQTKTITYLQQQLDETKGEALLLRKRHEASVKELSKELRRQVKDVGSEPMSQSSRTSSCSSLNDTEPPKSRSPKNPPPEKTSETDVAPIPDQQIFIEKIIKLQRMLAKKQEKIDFLQDHGEQLVDELQKKCKIIQSFALHQEPGAMSTAKSDRNKAEMVKHGGVMASLFASKPSDDGLTLELSIEINSKLQAVLEDSLLKNITLKENVDALGEEISRLSNLNKLLSEKVEELSRSSVR